MEKVRHSLDKYLDHGLSAFIPLIRKDGVVPITIRTVENGGIWIENAYIHFGAGQQHSVGQTSDSPFEALEDLPPTVLFFPWAAIGYILAGDTLDIPKDELLHLVPKGPREAEPPEPGGEPSR